MELMQKWELPNPFMIDGKWCVAIVNTTSSIRIFYDNNVYDVVIGHEEMSKLLSSGIDHRRCFVKDVVRKYTDAKPTRHHADSRDLFVV